MTLANYRTSNATKKYLLQIDEYRIGWGHSGHLDEIYNAINPNFTDTHPIKKWKIVLDGLDRDIRRGCDIFEKSYVNIFGRMCRVFIMKDVGAL